MIKPIYKKMCYLPPSPRKYYFEPVALNIIRIEFRAYASKSFLFDWKIQPLKIKVSYQVSYNKVRKSSMSS